MPLVNAYTVVLSDSDGATVTVRIMGADADQACAAAQDTAHGATGRAHKLVSIQLDY